MAELSAELKATIQDGYRSFLKSRDLQPRTGQRQMIGAIAASLGKVDIDEDGKRDGEVPICVVEAGTGTGTEAGVAALSRTLGALSREMAKAVAAAAGRPAP